MDAFEWSPSEETLKIVSQAGYSESTISNAVIQYREFAQENPTLALKTDKDFYLYLRTLYIDESEKVEKRFKRVGVKWRPSEQEITKLLELGYWNDLVDNQLMFFALQEDEEYRIIKSRFNVFRAYLSRRIPIPLLYSDIETWAPTKVLLAYFNAELGVAPKTIFNKISGFKEEFLKTGNSAQYLPMYIYSNLGGQSLPALRI
jgi:hypothetical protein